jgi:hypothetical protein
VNVEMLLSVQRSLLRPISGLASGNHMFQLPRRYGCIGNVLLLGSLVIVVIVRKMHQLCVTYSDASRPLQIGWIRAEKSYDSTF